MTRNYGGEYSCEHAPTRRAERRLQIEMVSVAKTAIGGRDSKIIFSLGIQIGRTYRPPELDQTGGSYTSSAGQGEADPAHPSA